VGVFSEHSVNSKRVDKQNTLLTKNAANDLYNATFCQIIALAVRYIKPCVCF